MSVKALETGAASARQLALDVLKPSHGASSIGERLSALAGALEDAARRIPPEGGDKTGCAILDASRGERRITRDLVEKWAGSDVVDKETALGLVRVDGLNFLFAAGLLRWHCGAIWLTDKHRKLWAEVVKRRSIRTLSKSAPAPDFSRFEGVSLWGFATTGENRAEQEDIVRRVIATPGGWQHGTGPEAGRGFSYKSAALFMMEEGYLNVCDGIVSGTPRLWHLLEAHRLRPEGEGANDG